MVNEKDLQSYLKIAAPALPCRAARKEFSSYVHNVARDISIENPDADFETIANMLRSHTQASRCRFCGMPIGTDNITMESFCEAP